MRVFDELVGLTLGRADHQSRSQLSRGVALEAKNVGISRIPRLPQEAAQIRAQRAAMLQTFRAYEGAVVTASNQLLTQYRDRNREHRTTEPPRHFAQRWQLPHSFLDSAEVRQLTAEPDKGYFFDDPYPLYGRHWRRHESARVAYSEQHADVFDELDEIKEATVAELDTVGQELKVLWLGFRPDFTHARRRNGPAFYYSAILAVALRRAAVLALIIARLIIAFRRR